MFTVDNAFFEQIRARMDYLYTRDKARDKAHNKVVPLALAIRRILVSAKVQEGLKLVREVQPGGLSFVGGYHLRRAADGTVDIWQDASLASRSLRNDLLTCALLKLGEKTTQLLTEQAICQLWPRYLVEPLEARIDCPQATGNPSHVNSLPAQATEAHRMHSLLNDLKFRVYEHFAGNFWGETKKGALLGHAIWRNVLDPEVASLTLKIFGPNASLRHYNRVVFHTAVLRQVSQETPHLMRLLGSLENRPDFDHMICSQMGQRLREHYLRQGFTPAGWAFLTQQGRSVSPFLAGLGSELVNRLAELQCGKLPTGRWLKTLTTRYYMAPVDEISKLLVLFAKAYAQRKVKAKDLTDNLLFVLDYLHQAKPKIGHQTTFLGFVKKQAEWHRKVAHEENQRQLANLKELYTWQPLVQSVDLGELKAISLTSSAELIEEGVAMAHCVGGYFRSCYQNRNRIFSVTLAGQRVATLEVLARGESWSQGQLYGPGNSKLTDKKVIQLAKRVVSACNKAQPLDPKLNTVQTLQPEVATPAKPLQLRPRRVLDARQEITMQDLLAA